MIAKKEAKNLDFLKDLGVHLIKDSFVPEKIKSIPTGSLSLNKSLEIGGWPEGKIVEIFGVDSSGKTTLALHSVAEAQKIGKTVVYIDLENTLNIDWAKKIGVNVDNLFVAKPENGEKAFELINKVLKVEQIGLIIVDSVAALVPSYEFENNLEEQTMGLHARLMSKGLRIMQSLMIGSKTVVIFINQIRDKIGNSFVPTTTTTGGRALKYAASVRVEIKKCESIRSSAEGNVIGFETKCIVVKNKFGSPLSISKSAIYFDNGFDLYYEIIHDLLNKQVLLKRGNWLEFEGKNIAQGFNKLRKILKENNELFERFKEKAFK